MEIMFSWQEHNGYHQIPIREHGPMMMLSSASPSPLTHSCIQHPISKLDTLPGIAIKYGVEVADIKKMNGLVTDRQMFGLKTLHIPLPARHPPPSIDSGTTGHGNDADHSPPDSGELFESFQSLRMQKLSPAISRLQGYYGTKLRMKKSISEIFDIAEYGEEASNSSHMSDRPLSLSLSLNLSHHQKLANRISDDNMEEARNGGSDKRRHETPELVLKEDNSSSGGFSSRTGKGLAQRQKGSSRIALAMATDSESGGLRKSSSTSCLQQQDRSTSSSILRKSLKPDLQATSTAKPIAAPPPRNKAALD